MALTPINTERIEDPRCLFCKLHIGVAVVSVLVLHESRTIQPQTLIRLTERRVPEDQVPAVTRDLRINGEGDTVGLVVLFVGFEDAQGSVWNHNVSPTMLVYPWTSQQELTLLSRLPGPCQLH